MTSEQIECYERFLTSLHILAMQDLISMARYMNVLNLMHIRKVTEGVRGWVVKDIFIPNQLYFNGEIEFARQMLAYEDYYNAE